MTTTFHDISEELQYKTDKVTRVKEIIEIMDAYLGSHEGAKKNLDYIESLDDDATLIVHCDHDDDFVTECIDRRLFSQFTQTFGTWQERYLELYYCCTFLTILDVKNLLITRAPLIYRKMICRFVHRMCTELWSSCNFADAAFCTIHNTLLKTIYMMYYDIDEEE